MKPRDTPCLWKFGFLYAWSAIAVSLGVAALPAMTGQAPASATSIAGYAILAFAAAVMWLSVRAHLAWRRGDVRPLRRALAALATQRLECSEMWLHRDDRLALQLASKGPSWFRKWAVVRIPGDADAAREIIGHGSAVTGYEAFTCFPVSQYVHRRQDAVTVTSGGESIAPEPPGRPLPVRAWQAFRMGRTGLLYAHAEEMRDLIRQLREAEPLSPERN